MYKVGVTGNFTAVHALVGDVPEEEKQPPPHAYLLAWILSVSELDDRGFSLDISILEEIRDQLFIDLEGCNLNDHDYFQKLSTSLENLCGFVSSSLLKELKKQSRDSDINRVAQMELRIWENDQAWAGIEIDMKSQNKRSTT